MPHTAGWRARKRAAEFSATLADRREAQREGHRVTKLESDAVIAGREVEASDYHKQVEDAIVEGLAVRAGSPTSVRAIKSLRSLAIQYNLLNAPWTDTKGKLREPGGGPALDRIFRLVDNQMRKGLTLRQALAVLGERSGVLMNRLGYNKSKNLLNLVWEVSDTAKLRRRRFMQRIAA